MAQTVEANWTGLFEIFSNQVAATETPIPAGNSQTLGLQPQLLLAAVGSGFSSTMSNNDNPVTTTGGALISDSGPVGTIADVSETLVTDQISLYSVKKGDTLSEIAEMYGVSVNTIAWANDMSVRTALKEGQVLVILPVSGVRHTVMKGETLQSIAKKYKGDAEEIAQFNDISNSSLVVGQVIIIPDGEVTPAAIPASNGKTPLPHGSGPSYVGYYIRPVSGGIKTQRLHGYNGIDIGISVGSQVRASAAGRVIISSEGGWHGGYGNYVVIQHPNKTQTLYAHLSKTLVFVGQNVDQGQLIGLTGNSGNSTGPHLHFEIRGAKNPF